MNVWDAALDLLLGGRCAGCGTPGRALCPACAAALAASSPVEFHAGGMAAVAGGRYEDELRAALLAFKERGNWALGRHVGERLAVAVAAIAGSAGGGRRIVLVPIPSRAGAVRERGLDTTAHLARAAARAVRRRVGVDVRVERHLRLVRKVADQAGLGEAARYSNLAGSLDASPLAPSSIGVIVDDVSTTGATLAEAHRAAKAAGWTPAGAAVVAFTPRRRPDLPGRPG